MQEEEMGGFGADHAACARQRKAPPLAASRGGIYADSGETEAVCWEVCASLRREPRAYKTASRGWGRVVEVWYSSVMGGDTEFL